jgi:hypothetical protein
LRSQVTLPPVTRRIDRQEVDGWAKRILAYEGEGGYRTLIAELESDRDFAHALLDQLAGHRDPVVRMWAADAAKAVFGLKAISFLSRLTKDSHPDVRDVARENLIGLDPASEQAMLPDLRRVLERGGDPWGEDRAAMWRVARLRDQPSVPILRAYAARYEPRYYHNRMPLVLADYIEDPSSIPRRIGEHDHEWMWWLWEAATLLEIPGSSAAFNAALAGPIDADCEGIIKEGREPASFR